MRIRKKEPMRLHTTFHTGGAADTFAEPETLDEIRELISVCNGSGTPFIVIGNGSNLLVSDEGFRGTVICLGPSFAKVRTDGTEIEAQAGARFAAVSQAALEAGLTGLEFASGIPGTVGGALVMNAGAYGGEVRDVLTSAEILETDGKPCRVPAESLELGYRSSNITALGRIILSAHFHLEPGDAAAIEAKMKDLNERRREKQPLEFASAGSTFKRPEGHFAGQLIERAGLKGFSIGDAAVSEKHAGFIINRGNAKSADIYALIREVQRRVAENSGVMLEPEVRFLGEFD